jgi:hypothetical protein
MTNATDAGAAEGRMSRCRSTKAMISTLTFIDFDVLRH